MSRLIFREKAISVKASSAEVSEALRKLACKNSLLNSFFDDGFSFNMCERYKRGFSAMRFYGTIEERGGECSVKYHIRPGVVPLLLLLICFIPFVYALALLPFRYVSLKFIAISAAFSLFIYFDIVGQERACEERFIRKLHELGNKEK